MTLRVVLFLFVALLFAPAAADSRLTQVTFADGRYYLIARPTGVTDPPLILALHGGGGSPAQFADSTRLTELALHKGYAIAFPAGSGRTRLLSWNALYCCAYAMTQGMDDVGFLDRVIADSAERFGTRKAQVFLTGMSNGSMMAETYAARRPGQVAAVAGVAGTPDLAQAPFRRFVPFLHIHGTSDQHVLYAGGVGPDSVVGTDVTSVADLLAAVLAVAPGGLVRKDTLVDPADDGMSVTRIAYGKGGRELVVHLRVDGGGHDWPGSRRAKRGGGTEDISANAEIIAFFGQFR